MFFHEIKWTNFTSEESFLKAICTHDDWYSSSPDSSAGRFISDTANELSTFSMVWIWATARTNKVRASIKHRQWLDNRHTLSCDIITAWKTKQPSCPMLCFSPAQTHFKQQEAGGATWWCHGGCLELKKEARTHWKHEEPDGCRQQCNSLPDIWRQSIKSAALPDTLLGLCSHTHRFVFWFKLK